MKKTIGTVIAVVLIGVAAPVLSQPTIGDSSDHQGGRYRLLLVNQGSYSTPYVIDTQTGRVWRQAVDSENQMLIFVSLNYRNIDGQLSLVPNETATGVFIRNKAPQNAPQKMDDDVPAAARLPGADQPPGKMRELKEKMNADMNKLFPNANLGGSTNSP